MSNDENFNNLMFATIKKCKWLSTKEKNTSFIISMQIKICRIWLSECKRKKK